MTMRPVQLGKNEGRTAVPIRTGDRAFPDFQKFRTVNGTTVPPTVRTFCPCITIVRDCGTAVLLLVSAKVAKNLNMKKRNTLNESYPMFFNKTNKMLRLPPKRSLFKVFSLTLTSKW